MPANLENSAVATGLEKVSFHSNPKKGNAKECSNYHTIAVISHTSKVILKILQARLQQYLNRELQMFKLDLEKAEEPEVNCQHLLDHRKSKSSRKMPTSISLTMLKPSTMWITLKRWEYQTT